MVIQFKDSALPLHPDLRAAWQPIRITAVNEATLATFTTDFNKLLNSPLEFVPLIVDSYGGHLTQLFGMIQLINSSIKPVLTYCPTKAYSAGSILLSCGTPGMRFASPLASIMVHEAWSSADGSPHEQINNAKETERLQDLMFGVLNKNCGKANGYFESLITKNKSADLYLDAKTAKKHGLIDRIGLPVVEVSVNLKTEVAIG